MRNKNKPQGKAKKSIGKRFLINLMVYSLFLIGILIMLYPFYISALNDYLDNVRVSLYKDSLQKAHDTQEKQLKAANEKLAKQESYILRNDFWTTTSNKQLCFVQHIISMLEEDGRTAIVLPDNVLFEGGAGETIRRKLLEETNLHTILRLPTGIFYANGVKCNVLFLDKKKSKKKEVWFYDYRTNVHHTLKKFPLQFEHLKSFVECYQASNRENTVETWNEQNLNGRFRKYTYDELISRDKVNFDITWLKDDSFIDLDSLPEPEILAQEIIDSLESALNSFREVVKSLSRKT